MDAVFFGGVEEVDGSVDVAVIGDGDGFLADFRDALDELFDIAGAVEKGVVGVQVKVGKFRHGCASILGRGARAARGGKRGTLCAGRDVYDGHTFC